ncbi:unnamed protein product, partial [Darwinula stevensoni]
DDPSDVAAQTPSSNAGFFILSDETFSSQQIARVRVEAQDVSAVANYGGVDIALYRVPEPLEFLQKQKNLHRITVNARADDKGLWSIFMQLWDSVAAQAQPQGIDKNDDSPRLSNGNVYIPLGKLAPGLYVVEAMLGAERAVTMVFVSDSVAVTKMANQKLLTWTVRRDNGAPVEGVHVVWTDGIGALGSGSTDGEGLLSLSHAAPEQTYVYGVDKQGGVFVSENYYYDSEIYNTKVYATTDRPLYRPDDTVNVKVLAREFLDARTSSLAEDAVIKLSVADPNGQPVAQQTLSFNKTEGGNTSFRLPKSAPMGGYEIQLQYQGQAYAAAFRVAEYQKPHFEIAVQQDPGGYRIGEKIKLKVQMRYPDGKPVKHASVDLSVRAQNLSVVEGELAYAGQFPLKLTEEQYSSDGSGELSVSLPDAKEASRYIVSILATDGAAYRVRHTQEILIDRALSSWSIATAKRFTQLGDTVTFQFKPEVESNTVKSLQWDWVRLEDRSVEHATISEGKSFNLNFKKSGSYQINLRDQDGKLLGATQHWVAGPDLKTTPGHTEVVWDKAEYQLGETASALITFSDPVDYALLSLERDSVEQTAIISAVSGRSSAAWVVGEKLSAHQWRIKLPVVEAFAPNITLSVAYVKNGQFVFENAGIKVAKAKIAVAVQADKAVYAPGEKVTLSVRTSVDGKPVPAHVALGVVDEMIYVLQPEIAPNIYDFFYHPRRNNVRTQASLSFIAYDLSSNQLGQLPQRRAVNERALKEQERARRDNVDTAAWMPNIHTNAQGMATLSFTMPDSLTRWRMTARAINDTGLVGQSTSYVRSDKDFYAKWTAPTWRRVGDTVHASVALFNQTSKKQDVSLLLSGAQNNTINTSLQPGINFVTLNLDKNALGALNISMKRGNKSDDKVLDALQVNLTQEPVGWTQAQSRLLDAADGGVIRLNLPTDASNVSLRVISANDADFYRVSDSLIEYPYGCVEQTSSRLIPLTLAYRALAPNDTRRKDISRQMYTQRLRLASMAGENAQFGWWGQDMSIDPFLTGYAYYADWQAVQALALNIPKDHWSRLLDVYAKNAQDMTPWQRALMLDWMRQMGLPISNMVMGLSKDLSINAKTKTNTKQRYSNSDSYMLGDQSEQTQAFAILLTQQLLRKTGSVAGARFTNLVPAAQSRVQAMNTPFALTLLQYLGDTGANNENSKKILAQ